MLSMSSSQTIHQIAAGTDVLGPAISAAASGDIIELVTDGGVYLNSSQFTIDQDITIRGAEGLVDKPILKYVGTAGSAYFFKNTGITNSLVLENLEFDGDGTADGASAKAKYVARMDNGDPTGTSNLFIDNCVAHDFNDKFIKPYGNNGMDSLVVTNSVFYNGASEGIVLYSGSSGDPAAVINHSIIENCTFYDIEREAIKGQTYPDNVVRISNVTVVRCGNVENKAMMYFRDMTDVVVKNSIFAHSTNADAGEEFVDMASDASLFKNNAWWDIVNFEVGNGTVSDTVNVNPQFADATNGDFSLPDNSQLLTFADNGGAIGDLRWGPSDGPFALAVFSVGDGSVALDPPGGEYEEGTVVTMTATPADLWLFDHWSDNVVVFPPDNPVATVTVDQSMAVTAYFLPSIDEYEITLNSIGYGHIEDTLYSDFGSLDGYFHGDSLVLTPVVDSTNWEFAYWVNHDGDSIDNASPLSYIVDNDTAFTAKFRSTLQQHSLSLVFVGDDGGNLFVDPLPVPGFETYDAGTVITIVADTELGWEFGGFSGDVVDDNDTISVTMNSDVSITVTFNEISHPDGILSIDDAWELLDAVEYAHNNSQVNTIKLTTVGPYEPSESLRDPSNGRMPMINIHSPVSIVGDPALESKPVVRGYTSTSNSTSSEGFFRLRAGSGKLTLKHLSIDGYLDPDSDAKPAKYLFRADDGADTVFCSIHADNVDFKSTVESFWKNYALAFIDTMRFEDCEVSGIGKEGIFLNSVGSANFIDITNSTFSDVGREILYLKNLPETKVNIDHVTISDCGFGYGTEGDKFGAVRIEQTTDVQLHNMIINNVTNTIYDYALRFAGSESVFDNVLLNNTSMKIHNRDDATIGEDVYWYDPDFVEPDSGDYTLSDSSLAYHMAGDGTSAIGDLRWATSTNVATYYEMDLEVSEHGKVEADPLPMAKFYIPNTSVTLTASADTLFKFGEWTGDLTGSDNPVNLTMDDDKNIVANFAEAFFNVEFNVNMSYWADLEQFSIVNDSVDIAGNFSSWGSDSIWMDDSDGDTIYTAQIKIDENFPNLEWKFRINGDDATSEFPGGTNRTLTVTQDSVVIYWYNDENSELSLGDGLLPLEYALGQNYPNPFNPSTTIDFAIQKAGNVILKLYDITGREIVTLFDQEMKPGFHEITFYDPMLPSGMYFYRIVSGEFVATRKMLLMK